MTNAQNAPDGTYSAEIGFEEPTARKDHKRAEDRLWLAGMAMQALIIGSNYDGPKIVEQAWAMADVMLEAQYN